MAAKYWLKLYHEMLDDPKIGRLGDRLCWRMIQCFLAAGELDEEGWLQSTEDLAWRLRMSAEELESDLIELQRVGVVQLREGRWYVVNFAERQGPVSGAERMRRLRDRKQAEEAKEAGYADMGGNTSSPATGGGSDEGVTKRNAEKIRGDKITGGVTKRNAEEKEPQTMPTHFPSLEPQARTIADAFVEEIKALGFKGANGFGEPSKRHLKEIAAGARDWVMEHGETPELLRETVRHMRSERLVVASPRSCIKVARQRSQWAQEDEVTLKVQDWLE